MEIILENEGLEGSPRTHVGAVGKGSRDREAPKVDHINNTMGSLWITTNISPVKWGWQSPRSCALSYGICTGIALKKKIPSRNIWIENAGVMKKGTHYRAAIVFIVQH